MEHNGLRLWLGLWLTLALVWSSASEPSLAGGPLFPGEQYDAGRSPRAVAIGDLNGDCLPDLAVACEYDNAVAVLLNNGDGTFARRVQYATGAGPEAVALGDLNRDGRTDAIVGNGSGLVREVLVFFNQGAGTFHPPMHYDFDATPRDFAIGDVDDDGWPDLAIATARSIAVLRNEGDGTLAPPVLYGTEGQAWRVVLADVDNDQRCDIAAAVGTAVAVLRNEGDGTFGPVMLYQGVAVCWSVAVGDLGGDVACDAGVTYMQIGGDVSGSIDVDGRGLIIGHMIRCLPVPVGVKRGL